MLLTIAIPTFERQFDLRALLASIARELAKDDLISSAIEVVVCDNASKDETSEVCSQFFGSIKNFRYQKNSTNIGFSRNFVECIRTASGDYVWPIGDDETIEPDSLRKIIELISANQYDILIFNYSMEPEPSGTLALKSVFGSEIYLGDIKLIDFVREHGWLWTLGNLGMVSVNRRKLLKVDPEEYLFSNFAQSAWYLEAFRDSTTCFINLAVYRTFIKSQTVNKERWKSDGTWIQMKTLVELLGLLISKGVVSQSVPIKFLNGCSMDRQPIWNYLFEYLLEGLKRNEIDIEKDWFDRSIYLINLLDDQELRLRLTSKVTIIFSSLSVAQHAKRLYVDRLGALIEDINENFPALRFGTRD